VADSSSIISAYERGSGKRQRRKFTFTGSFTTVRDEFHPGASTFTPTSVTWDLGTDKVLTTMEEHAYFTGAFKYYLAPTGMRRYQQLASRLYGSPLTPALLWELAPWSWAADWFGNFGDVFANVSYLASDATVMEWGYMMSGIEVENTITSTAPYWSRYVPRSGESETATTVERVSLKSRIKGSPYSFALTPAVLTMKQQAILVALGLSRRVDHARL
jgi:hypothetical protein